MDFLPDTDVSVRVMFEGLGQPKVPDTGTVSWTLRGDAGDIVLVDRAPLTGSCLQLCHRHGARRP